MGEIAMYTDQEITIRPIKQRDCKRLWECMYKDELPAWKQWDAPYYPHETKTFAQFLRVSDQFIDQPARWAIEVHGIVCGMVSYYWEHKPSHWLEMGILLFEEETWGKGIGTRVLALWMKHLFDTLPLVRIGLTTWSGNERMVRVAEKIGMQMEARIRKVRLYEGVYYDSIRMGMLREEWEKIKQTI